MNSHFKAVSRQGRWALCSGLIGLGLVGTCEAAELLANGNFEDGTFSGWSTATKNSFGVFTVDDDTLSDFSFNTTVGPAEGAYFALTDAVWSGAQVLWQAVTVPPNSAVTVSYRLFANSYAHVVVGGADLDETGPAPNQHARVDLLPLAGFLANPYATGSALNLWVGGTELSPEDSPTSYVLHSHDVTSFSGAGGTYVLRFGVVANQDVFNLGVDAVSFIATEVPEAGATAPAILSVLLLAGLGRRHWSRPARPSSP
jgi:hypothetical protein